MGEVVTLTGVLLSVRDLEVTYGPIPAVRGVSFDVAEADRVAIVGRNGAGKTSTLRAAAGITAATRGVVELAGEDVSGRPARERLARGLALVPEGRGLFGPLSVRENLLVGAYHRHLPRGALADELDRVTAPFPRLRERMAQSAGSLSGGEQQMLVVARALMTKPRVLLIDEPSLGLSPIAVEELYGLLEGLSTDGIAIVVVEQYVDLALGFARHGYVLDKGVVAMEGAAAELREHTDVVDVYMAAV